MLAIAQAKTLVLLKTAYDESLAVYSPGRLMMLEMMKTLFADPRIAGVEFYTNATSEDLRWGTASRTLYNVNCYRSAAHRRIAGIVRRIRSGGRAPSPRESGDADVPPRAPSPLLPVAGSEESPDRS